ncbi:ATP-dependent acyl-CoA ligase [Streptomyces tendae]|uniref:ATP-dependent acyl-CoA ligase n=1 Tax=Streptomyces tendae TaxID=1932 RepID=UPI00380F58BA
MSDATAVPDLTRASVPGLLQWRADITPDSILLRCGDTQRTAAQMLERVAVAGGLLRRHGVERGDRVALMASNRVELLDLILGCAWIGAVAVPINTAARGEQLHHILTNSQAELLVLEHPFLAQVEALPSTAELRQIWLLDEDEVVSVLPVPVDLIPDDGRAVEPVAVGPGHPAVILYTSGTTGVSKGVVCPHAQFYWWGRNVTAQLGITSDDVLHTCLPLFHTNALNAFSQALVSGAQYVIGPRFSASRFWSDVTASGATCTYLLGAMISILASRPPGEHDRAHRVTAALAPATPAGLLREFEERFGVVLIDGYGSTETNAVISASRTEQRPGFVGLLQEGFSARVVDENGLDVPPGTPGELLLRSEQPFAFASGYHRMHEATVAAWQDLWFHTGDRMVIEADGWIRFVDRIKDVIRRRGENISSVEVESVLAQHPGVRDVAVYAVDSELGEDEVMAAVVPVEGQKIDFAELVSFCEPRLAYYAIPRFVALCPELPLTENGKVRKTVLREWGADRADWDREAAGVVLRRDQPTTVRSEGACT